MVSEICVSLVAEFFKVDESSGCLGGCRVGLLGGVLGWAVDPYGVREVENLRWAGGAKAVRVSGAGLGEYRAPVGSVVGGQPEVHVGGCV